MDLELNSEGGSGGPTSACSDQLFDACGAEPVLDLPHRGVVGRAQPRTSSIAQLSERLPARQKIEPSPGRCRASCAPIRSPPGSGSSLVCRAPAAVVGEHGDVEV